MREEFVNLFEFIEKETADRASMRLLEAGCGSMSHFRFERDIHLVGIDISEEQLQKNKGLDERILGDIQTYAFPPSSFDIIVCVDVLEHLTEPQLALTNFAAAAKQGGMIVLKLPNVFSLKGLATKLCPHSLHRLAYRFLQSARGKKGRSATGPFKTHLKLAASLGALRRSASKLGLREVYFDSYDITETEWLSRRGWASVVYRIFKSIFWVISFGRLGESEFILVLEKVTDR